MSHHAVCRAAVRPVSWCIEIREEQKPPNISNLSAPKLSTLFYKITFFNISPVHQISMSLLMLPLNIIYMYCDLFRK